LIYIISRGFPGIIAFLAIAVYTRLLSPDEYGQFAIVVALVGLFNTIIFYWLRVGVARFWAANEKQRSMFLSTLAVGFASLLIFSFICGVLIFFLASNYLGGLKLFVLGMLYLTIQAWFDLNLELLRAQLRPIGYGILFSLKALLSFLLGCFFVFLGMGAAGLLVGILLGTLFPTFFLIFREWNVIRIHLVNFSLLSKLVHFGLPLTLTFALNFIVNTSDRLLIGWLLGSVETGLYSVAYDLTHQAIGVLCMFVSLSTYPIIVRALEQEGIDAARQHLYQHAILIFFVLFPAVAGIIILSSNIAEVLIGQAFQKAARDIIPWIAIASFLGFAKSQYIDLVFSLSKRTLMLVWSSGAAAILNIILNLWLIPQKGIMGAVYSTVISYGVGLFLSWKIGKGIFYIPIPKVDIFKIFLATIGMCLSVWPVAHYKGLLNLSWQILWGVGVYFFLTLILNVGDARELGIRVWRKLPTALKS
jgi:O-antigen/teichoic acid export membrane protein